MRRVEDPYKVLGLEGGATLEQARQAHKDLVQVWHPDRFSYSPGLQERAQQKLRAINEAYQSLLSSDQFEGQGAGSVFASWYESPSEPVNDSLPVQGERKLAAGGKKGSRGLASVSPLAWLALGVVFILLVMSSLLGLLLVLILR
jgi:curved DNA-binding protein CbpA